MINIEKEFYSEIEKKFDHNKSVAYHLVQMGCIDTYQMERYLICSEFKAITDRNISEGKQKGTIQAFKDLAAKYNKSYGSIAYIINAYIKV